MSNIVFILGAGASRACGAPLMVDFLDTALDLLKYNAVQDKRQHFERVFDTIGSLQAVHSKAELDLNNIESIFSTLEMSKILRKLPGFHGDEITTVIASLKELIVTTLEKTIQFPIKNESINAPVPYDIFADLIRHLIKKVGHFQQSVSIITFNYDIALDAALHFGGLGSAYNYCLEEITNTDTQIIPLLKLHGL